MVDWVVVLGAATGGYIIGQLLPVKLTQETDMKPRRITLSGIAIFLAGLLTIVFALSFGQQRRNDREDDARQSEIVGCIADWATKFDTAQRERTEANTTKDSARDDFLLAAGTLLQTDMASEDELAETREAFVAYRAATRELDQKRASFPYPAFPPTGCGR